MTAGVPPCPHGEWVEHEGQVIRPPSCDCPDVVSVSRAVWLDALAEAVADRGTELTPNDLVLAHSFTRDHFDEATGEGTRHQTLSYFMARAGLKSQGTVKGFLRRCREGQFLSAMPGRSQVIGDGRATPLYRLTLPS